MVTLGHMKGMKLHLRDDLRDAIRRNAAPCPHRFVATAHACSPATLRYRAQRCPIMRIIPISTGPDWLASFEDWNNDMP